MILAIVLLPSLALASFTVRLENNFDRKMLYFFYWIDHPYKMLYFFYWIDHPYGWRAPANMAGGELEASETTRLGGNFQQGKYRIVWKDKDQWKNEMLIHIKKDVTRITVRPEKVEF
jgi:hypothetical protein